MFGFFAKSSDKYIEKVAQKSASLSLIAHGDGIEILIQEIKENTISFIEPFNNGELLEFFFILKGKLICSQEGKNDIILKSGDYFYAHNITSPVEIKTLEPTTLLYVTSKPIFKYLSKDISELKKIMHRVEEKDAYTHGHGKRVRDLAYVLGNKLGLSKGKMERLLMGALFHDIGKINIPDEILKKPGKLTPEEFEYIKRHPIDGAEMVKGTFLEGISEVIRQHHERIDGSGYPDGLKGDEILIEAKIIAIVDSFDAMTSKRPYRDALGWEKALEELKSLAGIKYDAELVKIFENCIEEGLI
ncbi:MULTISPECIES: HD-GYP domain-containing protein [Kosmotoga]|jgi:putative nucleotidyltransferase with HDIG domain|uniref:Metal dependent phosphohydrolase n=1 Tax=Kosmotoga olearia (strain ATCC BAA-1733 / DSM 21960 / TBF 19.5.1) TaxID=521045 RepID=C5CFZ3_KOSOT|nr:MULTISPECIES: HD-GYP domain-containing protein [Kosmotoga]ACR80487.1 metal dependent phosphohydrolase [Kosmotoga olearia TBF 19.5.1]MDI3524652.1 hypothetical protein [Kosmotoga sp.]MDK2954452.1 hypothetical protein [Kosmotoga sp.]OAA19745.1 phosphohydrolase [Kosmotoga sp. DU53]